MMIMVEESLAVIKVENVVVNTIGAGDTHCGGSDCWTAIKMVIHLQKYVRVGNKSFCTSYSARSWKPYLIVFVIT